MLVVTVIPIQQWMLRKGWPRWLAITTVVAGAYGILLGPRADPALRGGASSPLWSRSTPRASAASRAGRQRTLLDSLGIGQKQIDAAISSISPDNVAPAIEPTCSRASVGWLARSSSCSPIIIFLGLDSLGFIDRLRYTQRHDQTSPVHSPTSASGTRTYLSVATIFGGIVAVVDTIALWIMGIPAPVLWGFVAFVTNYIPNIGFVIGVIPPAILGLLVGGWELMLLVIVVYSVVNFIIQSIIQPKFVGDSVNLATTVTFLSMAIWTWTIGPLGALLAVPLTLLTKAILIDLDPSTRWIGTLLGSTTPEHGSSAAADEPLTPAVADQPDG